MWSADDIRDFYKYYKENIGVIRQMENELSNASSKEKWSENLKKKSLLIREKQVSNEKLFKEYIKIYIDDYRNLTDEVVEAIFDETVKMLNEGFVDVFMLSEIMKSVYDYAKDKQKMEYQIAASQYYGFGLGNLDVQYYGEKACAAYKTAADFYPSYSAISTVNYRKMLIICIQSYGLLRSSYDVLTKKGDYSSLFTASDQLKKLYAANQGIMEEEERIFCTNAIERCEYLPFEVLIQDVGGAIPREVREKVCIRLGEHYSLQADRVRRTNDDGLLRLILMYVKNTMGEMSDKDYCDRLKDFIDNIDYAKIPEVKIMDDIVQMPYFVLCTLYFIAYSTAKDKIVKTVEEREKADEKIATAALEFMNHAVYTNSTLIMSVYGMNMLYLVTSRLPYYEGIADDLYHITIFNQTATSIHSKMVSHIALMITNEILKSAPEIMIGLPGLNTVADVMKSNAEILQYISEAAILHDIGKVYVCDLINMQERTLTDIEFDYIKKHTNFGRNILYESKGLSRYSDIAMGHHKYYDGSSGYPEEFDNCSSPYKTYIDIISIADSIDAATDKVSRNYAKGKDFMSVLRELSLQKNVRYSGAIVEVIEKSEKLQEKLSELTSNGRNDIYYEVYSEHLLANSCLQ